MKNKILSIVGLGCFLLLHGVFASYSHARIIGFEDFDGGGYGWNWDNSVAHAAVQDGDSAGWFNIATGVTPDPDVMPIVNGAAQVTGVKIGRIYHSGALGNGAGAGERLGGLQTGATYHERGFVQFNLTATGSIGTSYAGMSFYDFGSEKVFYGITNGNLIITGTTKYFNEQNTPMAAEAGKEYQIVGLWDFNPAGTYMWVFEPGYQPQYSDLFTPYAQRTNPPNNWNTRVALNVGNNIAGNFDNITVATEHSDIFGAPPEVKQIRESFSGYENGAIAGQLYRNLGQRAPGAWSGASAFDNNRNLAYSAAATKDPENLWASEGGALVSTSNDNRMDLDPQVFNQWGLLGSDGYVGGVDIDGTLYFGFLTEVDPTTVTWAGGPQLYRGDTEFAGFVKNGTPTGFSMWTSVYSKYPGEPALDDKTHLVIGKLEYSSTGNDTVTIWFDPDLTKTGLDAANASVTHTSANLSFDNIRFRNNGTATYDEYRMATTWNDLTGYSATAPKSFRESFTGYDAGDSFEKAYLRDGEAVGGQWGKRNAGDTSAVFRPNENLVYGKGGWNSEAGLLATAGAANQNSAVLNFDMRMIDEWGLLGSNGMIGGTGVDGELYYGFLVQTPSGSTKEWAAGPQLMQGGSEVLGILHANNTTNYNLFGRASGNFLTDLDDPSSMIAINDADVHLIVAKIAYDSDGNDDLTIWFDPDMGILEDDSAIVYQKDGAADLQFDNIIFRNGANGWLYDEFRMATSWGALADGSSGGAVPEPATWLMLLLGAGAVLAMRRKRG